MILPSLGLQKDSAVRRDQYRAVVGQTRLTSEDIERLTALTGNVVVRVVPVFPFVPGTIIMPDDMDPLPRQCGVVTRSTASFNHLDLIWFEYGRGALFVVDGDEYAVLRDEDVVMRQESAGAPSMVGPNILVRVLRSPDYAKGSDIILMPTDKKRYYEEGVVVRTPALPTGVEEGQHIVFEYSAGSAIRVGDEILRVIDRGQLWGVLDG
jgi:co-chaperonin GroES (HSP10)